VLAIGHGFAFLDNEGRLDAIETLPSAREWLEPDVLEQEPDAGAVFVCRPGVSGRLAMTFGG
jgi:hypothetical protein